MKLRDIAAALDARLVGDGSIDIDRPVYPSDAEGGRDLALAMEPKAVDLLKASRARAAIVRDEGKLPEHGLDGYIVIGRSRYAMARLLELFPRPPHSDPGIHPSAVVAKDAELAADVRVGPFCSVGPGAKIGAGTILLAHVSVGAAAIIGVRCLFHPGTRIGERVVIGDRVIIQHNACIGADGFGYVTPEPGSVESAKETSAVETTNDALVRINSIGTVVLEDDVEVGALSAIDRGTVSATRVGRNTKIDDLVMVGHNCVIGENCMLCGQVGIAGSSTLGDRVVLGGKVGVGDHLTIGSDSVIAAGTMIGRNVAPRSVLMGYPAMTRSLAQELIMHIFRLPRLAQDVAELKRRLAASGPRDRGSGQ